jgi:hypothetical protein
MSTKIDLYGSTIQYGVTDWRYTRAVRRARVADLANTQAAMANAIDEVIALAGTDPHPNISDLPLQSVRAVKFGPTKAWIDLNYAYGRINNAPSQQANLLVRMKLGTDPINIYRSFRNQSGGLMVNSFGMPTGPYLFPESLLADPTQHPRGRIYLRPVFKMSLPTTLTFHPYPYVGFMVGTVNSDTVGYAGFDFPPGWIRFDGCDVDVLETTNGVRFPTVYHFTIARFGHYEQELQSNAAGTGWEVINVLPYLESPFLNKFPVGA